MSENLNKPPKDNADGRQKFFWWRLSEPWWSLSVAVTISAIYFGIPLTMFYLAMRFGPLLGPRAD